MEIQYWVPLENGLNPEKKTALLVHWKARFELVRCFAYKFDDA